MRSIAIVFFVLLISQCIAEPDNVTTGSYNISFDLGLPKEAYAVSAVDPKRTESSEMKFTDYTIYIRDNNRTTKLASIIINASSGAPIPILSPDEMRIGLLLTFSNGNCRNIETYERDIDGKRGAIASGELNASGLNTKIYQAMYHPFYYAAVVITSSYPWDEGTQQLLNTIHIENMNNKSFSFVSLALNSASIRYLDIGRQAGRAEVISKTTEDDEIITQCRNAIGDYNEALKVICNESRYNELKMIRFPESTSDLVDKYGDYIGPGVSYDRNRHFSNDTDVMYLTVGRHAGYAEAFGQTIEANFYGNGTEKINDSAVLGFILQCNAAISAYNDLLKRHCDEISFYYDELKIEEFSEPIMPPSLMIP
jgi:hypothetical protein